MSDMITLSRAQRNLRGLVVDNGIGAGETFKHLLLANWRKPELQRV